MIELSFLLQFSEQTSYNSVMPAPGLSPNNLLQDVVNNYWQKEGDLAKYEKASANINLSSPGSSAYYAQAYANTSNASYVSSSFIRLKTLSLSYTFPRALLKKGALKRGKVFIQGQNLFTVSNFHALDPEANVFSLPPLLMITAGLNITL
jgi:hypothetical protein